MTNQTILPYSNSLSNLSDLNSLLQIGNKSQPGTDFNELFSSLLSSTDMFSGSDSSGQSSTDFTPMLLLLFSKLFNESNASTSTQNESIIPQGTPVKGTITQGSHEGHVAIDFGVPVGTSVHSTMSGKVIYAGFNNEGYGNLVIVENGAYKTYYAHLSSIPVKIGQSINGGEVIGLSGNTGNSTGPHVHYEIRKNGVAIDPTTTINE
jgi:murein DD-endopeptidase MepM/ murein hydrolase activator NlpD